MPWPVTATRVAYENPWLRVREDVVVRPDGAPGLYGVVEVGDAVFVIAIDSDDRVVLVDVDRHTVGRSLEVPAGGTDGELPLAAAQRELAEETGLAAESWQPLGTLHALNGIARAREHVFLARELTAIDDSTATRLAEGILDVRRVPVRDAWAAIAAGDIRDSESISALALAMQCLGRMR